MSNGHGVSIKDHKIGIAFGALLLVVGLIPLTIGIRQASTGYQFVSKGVEASGVVTALERGRSGSHSSRRKKSGRGTYYPVFEYTTASGETHGARHNIGSKPPSYKVGERVDVIYIPGMENKARIKSFGSLWGMAIGFSAFGLVFALLGGAIISGSRKEIRKKEYLARHGRRLSAEVTAVERRRNNAGKKRRPYWVIRAQWRGDAGNAVHPFESDRLRIDPTEYVGETVGVTIDPQDPTRYVMDLGFLPR